ncbi:MAG TPA: BON domain-containing protein, partial [Candidatus Tectomicrobia bacterium]
MMKKSDEQIHQEVLRELRWDSRVDDTEVGVEVDQGVVTLTGTVASYAMLWSNRNGHWDKRGMILPGGVPVWQRNARRIRQSASRKPSASLRTNA